MASYVQYLNVGFGIFNNTQEIETWSIEEAMEKALLLDDPDTDIRIIGFRFFDKDIETNALVKQSGIFYLSGAVVQNPKADPEVVSFFRNTGKDFNENKKMIKITNPFLVVYPYHDGDKILDTSTVMAKISAQKGQDRIKKLRESIEEYKKSIVVELEKMIEAIEENAFHAIPMIDSDDSSEVKHLNILNDGGNFNKHIDYLRKQRIELLNTENGMKEKK